MDEQQLRALGGGQLEQLGVGGDAGGERRDPLRPGHLQAVDAVVLEALRFEQAIELAQHLACGGGHAAKIAPGLVCDTPEGIGAWRSLVARTVRVGEVPSSNLGAPIVLENREYPRMRAKGPETLGVAEAVFAGFRGCSWGLGPQMDRSD